MFTDKDNNIVGYLQRRQFFQPRTPSPSPNSRFKPKMSTQHSQLDLKGVTPPHIIQPQQPDRKDNPKEHKKNVLEIVKENQNIKLLEKTKRESYPRNSPYADKAMIKSNSKREKQFNSMAKSRKTSSFDSSRLEIKMCLEDFSRRVSTELKLLEASISQFTHHIEQLFQQRLQTLKQELFKSVEVVFAKAKTDLSQTLSSETQNQLSKIKLTKSKLSQVDTTLTRLRGDMEQSWKRVAAQVFGDSLDEKIEVMLSESEKMRKEMGTMKEVDKEGWGILKKGLQMLLLSHFAGNQKNNSIPAQPPS